MLVLRSKAVDVETAHICDSETAATERPMLSMLVGFAGMRCSRPSRFKSADAHEHAALVRALGGRK